MIRKCLILGLSIAAGFANGQGTWIQKDSVSGPPKSACVAFANGVAGYIGLGFDQVDYKRSLHAYNPSFDLWDKVESLGGITGLGLNRSSAVAFVVGSKAYVGTGQGANPYFGDFWEYDMSTNTWTQVANFGGSPRREAVAFGIGNFGYAGTGQDANGLTNDFWKYDPVTNQWTSVSNFPGTARKQAVGFAMSSRGYVGTGDDGTLRDDFFAYDPGTNLWSQKNNFGGTPRCGAVGFGILHNGYIGTGYDNTLNYTNDFWEYNRFADAWTQLPNFPGTARSNAAAFSIGTRGYVGTGYDGQTLDDFYEYTAVLGLEEHQLHESKVYPNPTSDYLSISIDSDFTSLGIEVYDIVGELVIQTTMRGSASKIDCSYLSEGQYVYVVNNETQVISTGKFVVKR